MLPFVNFKKSLLDNQQRFIREVMGSLWLLPFLSTRFILILTQYGVNTALSNILLYSIIVNLAIFSLAAMALLTARDAIHADDLQRYDEVMKTVAGNHILNFYPENQVVKLDIHEYPTEQPEWTPPIESAEETSLWEFLTNRIRDSFLDVRGSEAVIGQESSYRLGSSVYRLGLHASGEEEAEISNMNCKELLLLGTESQVPR
ncbi:hypothetical protein Ddc_22302 [Ditylenchus destructor]|nr:hypothetical protein Ddc_22302 [Ditylenchus destructor]